MYPHLSLADFMITLTTVGKPQGVSIYVIMSTPLGGGYIIFAFSAVRCPVSDVRRPMSGVTHGFRSFKGKVLELLDHGVTHGFRSFKGKVLELLDHQIWYAGLLGR